MERGTKPFNSSRRQMTLWFERNSNGVHLYSTTLLLTPANRFVCTPFGNLLSVTKSISLYVIPLECTLSVYSHPFISFLPHFFHFFSVNFYNLVLSPMRWCFSHALQHTQLTYFSKPHFPRDIYFTINLVNMCMEPLFGAYTHKSTNNFALISSNKSGTCWWIRLDWMYCQRIVSIFCNRYMDIIYRYNGVLQYQLTMK